MNVLRLRFFVGAVLLVLPLLSLGGCRPGQTAGRSVDEPSRYLLTEEPASARGVVEIKSALAESEEPSQPVDVVLVGTIGGEAGFIWEPDRAAFTVMDASVVDTGHAHAGHDADNCPFCRAAKRDALAGTALVRVVDERGDVPPINASQLLGLSEGQTIVVRGKGHIGGLGNLVVDANGVFVRP